LQRLYFDNVSSKNSRKGAQHFLRASHGFAFCGVVFLCCRVLRRVAVSSALCVAVCCTVLQCVTRSTFWRASCEFAFYDFVFLRRSMLQRVAVCCSLLQYAATCCSVLQCFARSTFCKQIMGLSSYVAVFVAACCSILQCVAIYCSVLQCFARAALCASKSCGCLLLLHLSFVAV